MSSGSFYNDQEAELVVAVIDRLVEQGVEPSAVGVITLYKAQQARTLQLLQTHNQRSVLMVMEKSWNMKNWPKIMEFCYQSWNVIICYVY